MSEEIVIPDKPAFKAAEVCELLKLQPYVLRSWENEFKDLGVSTSPGGPRVYRRVDVERAVRIRELMLRDGLTLAGVRRRLEQDSNTTGAEDALIAEISSASGQPPAPSARDADRERVAQVKQGLRNLLDVLSRPAVVPSPSAGGPQATPPGAQSPAAHRAKAPRRDLTVEVDEGPSLFAGVEQPVRGAGSGDPPQPKRKRAGRAATPAAD